MTAVATLAMSSVASKTLWERRRSLLWWTAGMVALAGLTIAFYPSIRSDTESFEELFESMPEGLLSVFGIEDTASLVTPSGFINSRLYSGIGPVILAVFGISLGSAAVAGEEDRGTLNLLLAQPLSRTRLVVEKALSIVISTVVVCTAIGVTVAVLNPMVDLGLSLVNIVAANVGLALMTLVFGAFSLAVGAVTGNRGLTVGASAALAGIGFFVNGLAPLVEGLEWTQRLTPFHWVQGPDRLTNGFSPAWSGLMVAVIAVLVTVALWGVNRRDIGT